MDYFKLILNTTIPDQHFPNTNSIEFLISYRSHSSSHMFHVFIFYDFSLICLSISVHVFC